MCSVLIVRVAQESSTHLCFAYVVLSASCFTNRQHVLYQPVHSVPSCYVLVAKLLLSFCACAAGVNDVINESCLMT